MHSARLVLVENKLLAPPLLPTSGKVCTLQQCAFSAAKCWGAIAIKLNTPGGAYLLVIAIFGLVVEDVKPRLWVEAGVIVSRFDEGGHVLGIVQGFHRLQIHTCNVTSIWHILISLLRLHTWSRMLTGWWLALCQSVYSLTIAENISRWCNWKRTL